MVAVAPTNEGSLSKRRSDRSVRTGSRYISGSVPEKSAAVAVYNCPSVMKVFFLNIGI